jgi:hypothetical protein
MASSNVLDVKPPDSFCATPNSGIGAIGVTHTMP